MRLPPNSKPQNVRLPPNLKPQNVRLPPNSKLHGGEILARQYDAKISPPCGIISKELMSSLQTDAQRRRLLDFLLFLLLDFDPPEVLPPFAGIFSVFPARSASPVIPFA